MPRSAGSRRSTSPCRSSGRISCTLVMWSLARRGPRVGRSSVACMGWSKALLRVTAALLLVCAARLGAQAARASEAQVEAVFLFNFAQFVDWPPEAVPDSQAPLVSGTFGGDPFGDFLDATVRGERRGARPFVVHRYQRVDDIMKCDILF